MVRTRDIGSNEKQLAALLSRIPLESGSLSRSRKLISDGIDWEAVIQQAAAWQVEPVVLGNLHSHFAANIPAELLAEIKRSEQLARAFAVTQTLRAADLAKSLQSAGVGVLVLKGPAAAIQAYGDCSRRTFADIDLIVKKKDLAVAHEHLLARGYKPLFQPGATENLIRGQHALEFEGNGPHVELHWSLLSRHLRFDLAPEDLWVEAVTIDCGGSELEALAPHHLFLYLCAHGAKHQWLRYRWVCDIAQLAQRLTPAQAQRVVSLAKETHTRRIVALALRLVRETFGNDILPFGRDAFGDDGAIDRLVAVAKARFGLTSDEAPSLLPRRLAAVHPYAEPLAFWIRSRERFRDRIICTARFAFEPTRSWRRLSRYIPRLRSR